MKMTGCLERREQLYKDAAKKIMRMSNDLTDEEIGRAFRNLWKGEIEDWLKDELIAVGKY